MPHIDIFPRKSSRAVKPGSPNCSGDLHLYNDDDDDDDDDDGDGDDDDDDNVNDDDGNDVDDDDYDTDDTNPGFPNCSGDLHLICMMTRMKSMIAIFDLNLIAYNDYSGVNSNS